MGNAKDKQIEGGQVEGGPTQGPTPEEDLNQETVMSNRWLRKNKDRRLGLVLAAMSQKGGTAKTTSVEALGIYLSQMGYNVLYLDLDPQGNCTMRLSPGASFPNNIAGALSGGQSWLKSGAWTPAQFLESVYECKVKALSKPLLLLPGSPELEQVLQQLTFNRKTEFGEVCSRLHVATDVFREYLDFILIDTPPSADSTLTKLVLEAADVVIAPVDGFDAVEGLTNLLSAVQGQNLSRAGKRSPLRTFVYCPHLTGDARNKPERSMWYLLLCEFFPQHFVKAAVQHSNTVHRTACPGKGWAGLGSRSKEQYRLLFQELLGMIDDPTLPPLTEWLDANQLTVPKLQQQVRKCLQRIGRRVKVKQVRFCRTADAKEKPALPDPINEKGP
jgi:cellulose biosynthesis protein BcsQ